jgi:hypothetical protein
MMIGRNRWVALRSPILRLLQKRWVALRSPILRSLGLLAIRALVVWWASACPMGLHFTAVTTPQRGGCGRATHPTLAGGIVAGWGDD